MGNNEKSNGVASLESSLLETIESMGDNHVGTSYGTPLREDAFDISDDEKIKKIQEHFKVIMETLGLDLTDDSLSGTPYRVAKMFVSEMFSGLKPENRPAMKTFENKYQYSQMLIEKNISFYSACEHHFLPIMGVAHVAYIPNDTVVGLSKLNRIVRYYAARPQVQERLTVQVLNAVKEALNTEDVAVFMEAKHLCVSSRGIKDESAITVTVEYSGAFKDNEQTRSEFVKFIESAGVPNT